MAKWDQDYESDDYGPSSRRQAYLDQMDEGGEGRASTGPVGPRELAPSPPSSGPLPPSAPSPSPSAGFVGNDVYTPSAGSPAAMGPNGGTPTTGLDPYTSQFAQMYQQLLGRQAGDADFLAQSQNPGGIAGVKSSILSSPEYALYQASKNTSQDPTKGNTKADYAGGPDQSILQLLQGGMDPQQAIALFNRTNGRGTGNEAVFYNDNRGVTIGLPTGYAALTPNGWTWTPRGPEGGQGGAIGGFDTSRGMTPEISQYFKALTDAVQQQLAQNQQLMQGRRDSLLRLMDQGNKPVDLQNDPVLKAQSDTYRVSKKRGEAEGRAALAERAAFTGLNSGGQGSGSFESGLASLGERTNEDIASHDAQLAYGELNARRQALLQAIQIADAIGARNEAQQLNTALAQIDAALKQAQMAQSQGMFEDQKAFDYTQLLEMANRNAYLGALNG